MRIDSRKKSSVVNVAKQVSKREYLRVFLDQHTSFLNIKNNRNKIQERKSTRLCGNGGRKRWVFSREKGTTADKKIWCWMQKNQLGWEIFLGRRSLALPFFPSLSLLCSNDQLLSVADLFSCLAISEWYYSLLILSRYLSPQRHTLYNLTYMPATLRYTRISSLLCEYAPLVFPGNSFFFSALLLTLYSKKIICRRMRYTRARDAGGHMVGLFWEQTPSSFFFSNEKK